MTREEGGKAVFSAGEVCCVHAGCEERRIRVIFLRDKAVRKLGFIQERPFRKLDH